MTISDMAKVARRSSTPDVDIPSHRSRRFSQPTPEYSKSYMEKFNDPDFEVGGSRDFEQDIKQRKRTDFSLKKKDTDIDVEDVTTTKTKNTEIADAQELERMKAENVKKELDRLRKERNFNKKERRAKLGYGLLGLLITSVGVYLKTSTWRKMFGDIPGTVKEIGETVKTIIKCFGGKDPDDDEPSCAEAAVKAAVPVILFFIIFILFLNFFRPK